jgi:predicted RNA-binding Zn-ribbon protein involved in translation (DUF1610 family)
MRLILIGQSGEVGKNGWTWDEMNNCTMLFIGDAIATAIKHANDLGTVNQNLENIQNTYKICSDWMKDANKNFPVENQYRLALIVSGGKYEFIEIPPALKGGIENNRSSIVSQKFASLSINTQNKPLPNNLESTIGEVGNKVSEVEIKCPKCTSINYKRNGKTKTDTPVQKYLCKDCGKSYTHTNLIT